MATTGALTNYLENKVLDHSLGKTSYTMPTTYLALYTTAPTDSSAGTEVSGGSYARQALSTALGAASGGSSTTSSDITFPTASASWGTVVAVGVCDASTAGNVLWYGTLDTSKAVGSGDVFKISSGQITFSLD